MLREEFLHELLRAVYHEEQLDIYKFSMQSAGENAEAFANTRLWAHQLVRDKLCAYCDLEKTQMEITNYGRYWMLHDGYLGFLKDEHALKEKEQKEKLLQKETLLEARLKLTQYRLAGFWWALIISIVGLVLSVFNLYLFLAKR